MCEEQISVDERRWGVVEIPDDVKSAQCVYENGTCCAWFLLSTGAGLAMGMPLDLAVNPSCMILPLLGVGRSCSPVYRYKRKVLDERKREAEGYSAPAAQNQMNRG